MDAILLDTDVFSFLMKGTDTRAELYKPHVKGKMIALSFVTVGELLAWGVRKNWGAKRFADLEQRIKTAVVVPYDLELCRQFGQNQGGDDESWPTGAFQRPLDRSVRSSTFHTARLPQFQTLP